MSTTIPTLFYRIITNYRLPSGISIAIRLNLKYL